ncbi:zinc ABC transporter substrate-binding protein [Candidatus Saccharibacteria bacterium]|nr:zinc ABC transporter substrate-binding protein [Candidatus Saccharibacteria bacterium]
MHTSKKVFYILAFCLALLLLVAFLLIPKSPKNLSPKIVTTNFISYDFARAVTGDSNSIKMLINPGSEIHDFEPTPEDIIAINNSELFIYVGGESDNWVFDLLKNNEISPEKTLRLMDFVEQRKDDEHIWTSLPNSIKLIREIEEKLVSLFPEKHTQYSENAENYIARLTKTDQEIREIVDNSNKKELIFADSFPFLYFVEEYGLNYFSAFPGCDEHSEPNANAISELIDKVKADNLKVVLKIELTNGKLANLVAEETGAKVLELNAAHNISREDFEKSLTFADIMEKNVEVLREALS